EARGKASLYRLLYGGRMAVEEVLLQLPEAALPALSRGTDGQSDAPSLMLHGVRVHSGDLLVSRGGAPTSAMIARGNDYPGTFSHVALVVIEDGEFETVEAHIERGVVVAGLERYEDDRKLRILLLRPRADRMGGGAAHRAALWARDEARRRTIAYDFASNLEDPSEMFCSEVAAHAYASEGVELWRERTTTSRVGPATWLSLFGVRRFETYGPSDLEYDPNLTVVAEWRNPDALFEDHVDSAAMDVLLDGADRGDALTFRIWMLPVARLLKAYSSVLNLFHIEGPIPEGMSPQAALRVNELGRRHDAIVAHVEAEAEGYRQREGHRPPYWELLEMARGAGAATL
ncbi:MAG: YiiX/YebB-like N1pC/P60 family cysteine hydrolase, partial [Myxococcota bacterium]